MIFFHGIGYPIDVVQYLQQKAPHQAKLCFVEILKKALFISADFLHSLFYDIFSLICHINTGYPLVFFVLPPADQAGFFQPCDGHIYSRRLYMQEVCDLLLAIPFFLHDPAQHRDLAGLDAQFHKLVKD